MLYRKPTRKSHLSFPSNKKKRRIKTDLYIKLLVLKIMKLKYVNRNGLKTLQLGLHSHDLNYIFQNYKKRAI